MTVQTGQKHKGCGCCSDCGVSPQHAEQNCCMCMCDRLCVTVTGDTPDPGTCLDPVPDGTCPCQETVDEVLWSEDDCAYIGEVCGIDLKITVKHCPEDETGTDCYLCLTSSCLGLTGQCLDECVEFTPGRKNDCGEYIKDCTQEGGFDVTWVVETSDCIDDCTTFTINAKCVDRVNPARIDATTLKCRCCDCVCEYVCIEYYEDNCVLLQQKVQWLDDKWEATFDCETPGDTGSQTLTVTIEADDDGICYWSLAASKGTVISMVEPELQRECPDPNLTWQIQDVNEPEADVGFVNVVCANCNDCEFVFCCCEESPLPAVVTATLYDIQECPCFDGQTVRLYQTAVTEYSPVLKYGTWIGEAVVCTDEAVVCTIRLRLECTASCQWELYYCGHDSDLETACLTPDAIAAGSCGEYSGPCCDPLLLTFGGPASDDLCCNPPTTPASQFCVVITE